MNGYEAVRAARRQAAEEFAPIRAKMTKRAIAKASARATAEEKAA